MPRKRNPTGRMKVTATLSRKLYSILSESAKSNSNTISSEAQQAIEFYLENNQRENFIESLAPLEHRMQKLENRLAGLMVKLVRVCGQNLWFSTLPFTKGGLPNKPLPQAAFQILWDQSRAFAANWLKKARLDEEQTEVIKTVAPAESSKS